MNDFLRFAGAQIPCSENINDNVNTIKKAIDWAEENSVDYLVTPEGSLSGYTTTFADDLDLLKSSLKTIEEYAASKKIGLFLGTLWVEDSEEESEKRNQIRFYDKEGILKGITNKIITTGHDFTIGIKDGEYLNFMMIEEQDKIIKTFGFICNDFYGKEGYPNLANIAFTNESVLFIHSTNAERNKSTIHDQVMNDWHNAHLRMVSYLAEVPVITVDNSWLMDGKEWDGMTSSPSGVLINGEWKVQAPRTGTQYFYYDLPIKNLIEKNWK